MSTFDDLHSRFADNLERTIQISELNNLIIDFAKQAIQGLGKITNPRTGADAVANQLKSFDKLAQSPKIREVLPIVYGQEVVLFVSSFESHLKEVVRTVGNHHISKVKWPENASGKIDLAELSRDSVTIGDLVYSIIEQRGISFQDLQSIKKFFKEYLGITVAVDQVYEQNLILAAAIRHSVIHSDGVVDQKFLKQIRNLSSDIRKSYAEGALIELDSETLTELRDSFVIYSDTIRKELNKQLVAEK